MCAEDGGDTGGFKEKMQAAKKAGATAVVIDRPLLPYKNIEIPSIVYNSFPLKTVPAWQ